MYTNADSLLNKLNELKARIKEKQYGIIAITEIFPKFKSVLIMTVEWCIAGYNMFHCPDKGLSDRGVLIYTNSNLKTFQPTITNNNLIETVNIGKECENKNISCSHVLIVALTQRTKQY